MNKDYDRTTITIPQDLYRKARVRAAQEQKSFSRFVAELLERGIGFRPRKITPLPFGKYRIGNKVNLDRKTIYEAYFGRKVSR